MKSVQQSSPSSVNFPFADEDHNETRTYGIGTLIEAAKIIDGTSCDAGSSGTLQNDDVQPEELSYECGRNLRSSSVSVNRSCRPAILLSERKSTHSNMEKQRRDILRQELEKLRNCIPSLKPGRRTQSNVAVLTLARQYIEELKKLEIELKTTKRDLTTQALRLKLRLAALRGRIACQNGRGSKSNTVPDLKSVSTAADEPSASNFAVQNPTVSSKAINGNAWKLPVNSSGREDTVDHLSIQTHARRETRKRSAASSLLNGVRGLSPKHRNEYSPISRRKTRTEKTMEGEPLLLSPASTQSRPQSANRPRRLATTRELVAAKRAAEAAAANSSTQTNSGIFVQVPAITSNPGSVQGVPHTNLALPQHSATQMRSAGYLLTAPLLLLPANAVTATQVTTTATTYTTRSSGKAAAAQQQEHVTTTTTRTATTTPVIIVATTMTPPPSRPPSTLPAISLNSYTPSSGACTPALPSPSSQSTTSSCYYASPPTPGSIIPSRSSSVSAQASPATTVLTVGRQPVIAIQCRPLTRSAAGVTRCTPRH